MSVPDHTSFWGQVYHHLISASAAGQSAQTVIRRIVDVANGDEQERVIGYLRSKLPPYDQFEVEYKRLLRVLLLPEFDGKHDFVLLQLELLAVGGSYDGLHEQLRQLRPVGSG